MGDFNIITCSIFLKKQKLWLNVREEVLTLLLI